jgi:C-methyltransferase
MMNSSLGFKEMQGQIFHMQEHIFANWRTSVVYVFAELDIAGIIYQSPKTLDELSSIVNIKPDILERYLRTVCTLDIAKKNLINGKYELTSFGELLLTDHPYSMRATARLNGANFRYDTWGHLLEILKDGSTKKYSPTVQNGIINYLLDQPIMLQVFHDAMSNLSAGQDDPIAASYDFSRFNHAIDLGSGQGNFIKAILRQNKHLKGTMFDASADEPQDPKIDDSDIADRFHKEKGDFFEYVPSNGDVYLMKNVIHNFPENKCFTILDNVYRAMTNENGSDVPVKDRRFLIIEFVIPEDNEFHIVKWLDLYFLVLGDGAERTLEQYRDLVGKRGFEITNVFPTPIGRSVIELAVKQ